MLGIGLGLMRSQHGTALSALGDALESLGYTGSYWYPGGDSAATLSGGLAWGTMSQSSTGDTPVTGLEQPVGFRMDRRYLAQASYGSNVVSTATYTGESAAAGSAHRIYSSAGAASAVEFASTLTVGQFYRVMFTIDSITTAGGGLLIGTAGATVLASGTGQFERGFVATSTTASIGRASGVTDIQISGVSFQAVTLPATVYGADVVVNGGFATDTIWSKGTGVAISGGEAAFTAVAAGANRLYQSGSLGGSPAQNSYEVTYTIGSYTSGSVRAVIGGGAGTYGVIRSAAGTVTEIISVAVGVTTDQIEVYVQSTFTGTIDNISVKRLKGTHLIQATSTARGTISAAYNLLAYSEQFDNAAWVKLNTSVVANTETGPFGGLTADTVTGTGATVTKYVAQSYGVAAVENVFSMFVKAGTHTFVQLIHSGNAQMYANFNLSTGVAGNTGSLTTSTITSIGNGWYWLKATFAPGTVGTGWRVYLVDSNTAAFAATTASTGTVHIWGADLRLGAHSTQSLPYYQQRGSLTGWDYATTGPMADGSTGVFPCYIRAQTDDSYATTRTMDFSATDEMYVSAGLMKQSDAAAAAVFEFGTPGLGDAGSFALYAPYSAGPNIGWYSRGTAQANALVSSSLYAAPKAIAATGYGKISADTCDITLDGVTTSAVADQGTGNYGNRTLQVYSRNGASVFANISGYYELAVDGRATTASSRAALTKQLARDLMKLSY